MKKHKQAVLGVAVFLVLAAVLFAVWQANRPQPEDGAKQITVQVVHSDGAEAEFTYRTDLEYLGELLTQEGLISGTKGEYGLFVDTVDGEQADYNLNGSWWRLSCNGEDAQTGVDEMVLQDGSVYTWSYTIG